MLNDPPPHEGTAAGSPDPVAAPSGLRIDLLRIAGVAALMAALMGIGYALQGPLKQLGPPQRCWENREIDGKLYKFNPCTGQFKLIGDVLPEEK